MTKDNKSKCCKNEQGPQGPQGSTGPTGPTGFGATGLTGATGPAGTSGILAYGDFYFSYTGGVSTSIGASGSVPFPNNTSLFSVSRDPILTNTVFILPLVGVYLIQTCFTISSAVTTNIALDSGLGFVDQPQTVYSQSSVASGTPVVYTTMAMITTTAANSRITFKNNGNSSGSLILPSAPFTGITTPVLPTGHLIITKVG